MASDEDYKIILYLHNYSFYSQKVLMTLNEKCIPYTTHFINIANGQQYEDTYLAINPRGEVPAIDDKGTIIPDSLRIINYLEEKYTNDKHPSIIPKDPSIAPKHDRFHNAIHAVPADVITVGAFVHNDVTGRSKLPFIFPVRRHMKYITERASSKVKELAEEKTGQLKETLLAKSEELKTMWETLINRESFLSELDKVDAILNEVEEQLVSVEGTGKWLLTESFTLADIGLCTLLERLNVLGLEGRFWTGGKRPKLQEYFDRIRRREQYKKSTPTSIFHLKTLIQGVTYLKL